MLILPYSGARWPVDWGGKDRLPKAQLNCPRCGRRMLTRIVYYECPGCGHVIKLPTLPRRGDRQPVDRIAASLRAALPARDPAARAFALLEVPPRLAREYYFLLLAGGVIAVLSVGYWGLLLWMAQAGIFGTAFKLCWGLLALGALFTPLALISPVPALKYAAMACGAALILISLCAYSFIPQAAIDLIIVSPRPTSQDYVKVFLATRIFLLAALYYAWLLFYLYREKLLVGY